MRWAARDLSSMDDRMLRDIGIDRSQIDGAVRGRRRQPGSAYRDPQ